MEAVTSCFHPSLYTLPRALSVSSSGLLSRADLWRQETNRSAYHSSAEGPRSCRIRVRQFSEPYGPVRVRGSCDGSDIKLRSVGLQLAGAVPHVALTLTKGRQDLPSKPGQSVCETAVGPELAEAIVLLFTARACSLTVWVSMRDDVRTYLICGFINRGLGLTERLTAFIGWRWILTALGRLLKRAVASGGRPRLS